MIDICAAFPKVQIAHLPTPIEKLENLSRHLGGCEVWIKRDDCTGLATGGNKVRKLEFLIGEAVRRNADTVLTHGAVQSNHVRQTAAACARFGLRFETVLEQRVNDPTKDYLKSGNVFLTQLIGADLSCRPAGADMNAVLEERAEALRKEGRIPYVIPGGGSNFVGSLGYVECAFEILDQSKEMEIDFDLVVHATGSGGTQSGLVAGMAMRPDGLPVLGIGVNRPEPLQRAHVYEHAVQTLQRIDKSACLREDDIRVDCRYVGDGYGVPTEAMIEAVLLGARLEGLLFDPVYTGKALAGLIGNMRAGAFRENKRILFIHTGGSASLFAYPEILDYSVHPRHGVE